MPRKILLLFTIIYLAVSAFYFFSALAVTEPGYTLDDAWIHQVFARNIATGHGFSFNPDVPISGATAPLWTLLMAVLWPFMGPIASGLIMGVLLMWLALIGAYKVAVTLTVDEKLSGFLLIASTICWPLIWGALSGMEIALFTALSLWGLYFYLRAESFAAPINYLSYLLFSLAVLARPECALFLAAAIVHDLWIWIRSPRKSVTPWLGRLLIIGVIFVPYIVFNYSTTGTVFPQTFTAKSQERGLITAVLNGDLKHILKSLTLYPYYYLEDFLMGLLILSPLIILALVSGIIKMISHTDRLRSRRIMLVILALLYIPLMGMFSPAVRATFQNMRMVANIIPLFFLLGLTGLFWQVKTRNYGKALLMTGAALGFLGGLLILMSAFIVRNAAHHLIQNASHLTSNDFTILTGIVIHTGRNIVILGFIIISGYFLGLEAVQNVMLRRKVTLVLVSIILIPLAISLFGRAETYVNDVAGVNTMDKAIGIYLHKLGGKGKVAVGDIGAIAYFSEMPVLDLRGLVSPELSPEAMMNDSLSFEYMSRYDQVDYVVVYPAWFRYISGRTDIFKPIKPYISQCSADPRDDTITIYRAIWPDTCNLRP